MKLWLLGIVYLWGVVFGTPTNNTLGLDFGASILPSNPMVVPTAGVMWPMNGCDNIYSQEILYWEDMLVMYYGGWEGTNDDCHDQIWVATSTDGATWRKYFNDDKPVPVLPNGNSALVNDPSIVVRPGINMMYYTDNYGGSDHVWVATSSTLWGYNKIGEIIGPCAPGTWCEFNPGRPAVIYQNGVWMMWFDANDANGVPAVGFANSTDGYNFDIYPGNPVLTDANGIDVKYFNGQYYMVIQGHQGTTLAQSWDGLNWNVQGLLLGLSGQGYDAYGHVVPSFQIDPSGTLISIWFGGAGNSNWDQNTINQATAYGQPWPTGAGCSYCTSSGISCARDCQMVGTSNDGTCAAVGSQNPNSCCDCSWDGCQGCINDGVTDCHLACVNTGNAIGGMCAYPDSTNPSMCCACI